MEWCSCYVANISSKSSININNALGIPQNVWGGVFCGAVDLALLFSIWFFYEKLCQEQLENFFFKLVFKSQGQYRLIHSWLVRDSAAGLGYSPSLFYLHDCIPNVPSFLVVKSGNAQAPDASQLRKSELKGSLWFIWGAYKGKQENSRQPPCCTLPSGLCVVQDRHPFGCLKLFSYV